MSDDRQFCIKRYNELFLAVAGKSGKPSETKEREAQKKAIRQTMIEAMQQFRDQECSTLWKSIYAAHVYRKSGIADPEKISATISADNSWKKSSGHAFEEIIKQLANVALEGSGLKVVLQKDLSAMHRDKMLSNPKPDYDWLTTPLKEGSFDLFIGIEREDKMQVFGCIQSKTSIRDRVTRDREFSDKAMKAFFWSAAIVLDGDFLRLPLFKGMVNGNTETFQTNGWHGLYVFSTKYSEDRIYAIDDKMKTFVAHAKLAAKQWVEQRQWLNAKWRADK